MRIRARGRRPASRPAAEHAPRPCPSVPRRASLTAARRPQLERLEAMEAAEERRDAERLMEASRRGSTLPITSLGVRGEVARARFYLKQPSVTGGAAAPPNPGSAPGPIA